MAPWLLSSILLAVVTGGCNREQPAPPKPEVAPGKGVVAGVVMFDGPPAAPKQVGTEKCCDAQTPIYDESLVVDAGGGMRNVVVFLENGPNVPTPASEPVVLDQVKCRYVPHVLAVRTGQTLRLKSTDPTLHNVHGQSTKNRAFNQSFTAPGESKDVTLAKPEWFEVRCDVHKWMSAWVAAFDHPFFAVTGEGGRFELKGVPAGTYTLVARHERYGEKRVQVTVPPGEAPAAVTAELRFAQ